MAQPKNREASRERREQQSSRAEYLRSVERETYIEDFNEWIAQNHEGEPPEARYEGSIQDADGKTIEKRKKVCEDVALKMKEQGLYIIADGVSSAAGWFASREVTMAFAELLGQDLDEYIDGLVQAVEGGNEKVSVDTITRDIASKIKSSFTLADQRVDAGVQLNPDQLGNKSGSTASVVKLVDIPDGAGGHIQRMFFATVGDSPIYVKRNNGRLEKISREDSYVNSLVDQGQLSQEDADRVAAARTYDEVPDNYKGLWRMRNVITKSFGSRETARNVDVSYIDLQPGDRVLITSDGVDKHFREHDLEGMMQLSNTDEALDQMVLERSLDQSKQRDLIYSDDIAAVSFTVGERGPSRDYVRNEQAPQQSKEGSREFQLDLRYNSPATIDRQTYELARLEEQRTELQDLFRAAGEALQTEERPELLRDRQKQKIGFVELAIATLKKEQEVDGARFSVERMRLDNVDMDVRPRFGQGDTVTVMVQDVQSGVMHPDNKPWKVIGYDQRRSEYTLESSSGQQLQKSRYRVELDQPRIQPKRGDRMTIPGPGGKWREKGFQVEDIDYRTGDILFVKEDETGRKERRIPSQEMTQIYQQRLLLAQSMKEQMDHYVQAYWSTDQAITKEETELEELRGQLHRTLELEARAEVMGRFQGEIRAHKEALAKLDRQIENAENVLERFDELSKKERLPRGLSSDERTELRKLKIQVYPNRNRPRLDEEYIRQLRDERDKLRRKVITRKDS